MDDYIEKSVNRADIFYIFSTQLKQLIIMSKNHKKKQIIEENKSISTLYRNLFTKTDNDESAESGTGKTEIVLLNISTGNLIPIPDIHISKPKCQNF